MEETGKGFPLLQNSFHPLVEVHTTQKMDAMGGDVVVRLKPVVC